jgi:ABC-type arginine transport system permease subunit
MAAAFTAALVDDVAPRVFRHMCAPEGRALITEVAGTCCASATRSLVLAARDVVFFVDTRPAARRVDEGEEEDGHRGGVSFGGMFRVARVPRLTAANAVRVAIAAVLVLWLVQALHAACAAVVGIVGFGSEDAIEAAQVAAAKAGGGETAASASKALGWWGS